MHRYTEESARVARLSPAAQFQLAVFAFRLPFDVALADGTYFSLRRSADDDEPPWVELTVRKVSVTLRDSALSPYSAGLAVVLGEAQPDLSDGSSAQTWVMAGTANSIFVDEPIELARAGHVDTIAFERCLAAVNRLVRAEQLLTGNLWSRPLTKESLDSLITYLFVGPDGQLTGERRQLRLHTRPYNPRVVTDDDDLPAKVRDAIGKRLASDAAAQPHPFVLPRELAAASWAQRMGGDAPGAIVTLQSSAETYLRGVHRMLLVDGGKTSGELAEANDRPFQSLLEKELPGLLGGNWSGATSPAQLYQNDLYKVRNSMTHAGVEPSWQRIQPAFDAYEGIVAFVEARVWQSWKNKPRTLLALAEAWAGGTRPPPRSSAVVIEALRREPVPYWLPHDLRSLSP